MAATLASTISAFAGSVMRPANEAFVDWARLNVNEVRRMKTNAATRRIDPNLTAAKKDFSRKGAKKTLRNAAALCAFAPLREKSPRTKFLTVQSGCQRLLPDFNCVNG